MSLINQPSILSGAFAAEGDKNIIPANNDGLAGLASIAKGFPPICQQPLAQGGLPPQRADFNGIFNLFSQFLLYGQVGGIYAYNSTLDYQPPCMVADPTTKMFYMCLQTNGPSTPAGVKDLSESLYWRSFDPTPVGTGIDFYADEPPAGYLVRNGAAVSRITYAALFAVIGTKYGAGDGNTTFNLPNSIGKFAQGDSTAGIEKEAGLPNVAGDVINSSADTAVFEEASGALQLGTVTNYKVPATGHGPFKLSKTLKLDASNSSSVYGNSDTVQPPALTVLPCIKY